MWQKDTCKMNGEPRKQQLNPGHFGRFKHPASDVFFMSQKEDLSVIKRTYGRPTDQEIIANRSDIHDTKDKKGYLLMTLFHWREMRLSNLLRSFLSIQTGKMRKQGSAKCTKQSHTGALGLITTDKSLFWRDYHASSRFRVLSPRVVPGTME